MIDGDQMNNILIDLSMRTTPNSNKYLLIFNDIPLKMWYKRYLRDNKDYIFTTFQEISRGGLQRFKFKKYLVINEPYSKEDIKIILKEKLYD